MYHFRNANEREGLRNELELSIQAQTVRKEIRAMGQTIAEALRAEGEHKGIVKGKQETLLLQLRRKYAKKVTPAIVASIRSTNDLDTLDEWLGRIVETDALEDVGIPKKG